MKHIFLLGYIVLLSIGCNCRSEKLKNWSYELDLNKNIQSCTSRISAGEFVECFYYPSGQIKAISKYKHNKINGEQLLFYANGMLKQKVSFREGVEWGKAYYYYESGVVQYERNWENGKKIGYCQDYYDVTGRIQAINLYNDEGQLFYRKTYDTKGQLILEEGNKPAISPN